MTFKTSTFFQTYTYTGLLRDRENLINNKLYLEEDSALWNLYFTNYNHCKLNVSLVLLHNIPIGIATLGRVMSRNHTIPKHTHNNIKYFNLGMINVFVSERYRNLGASKILLKNLMFEFSNNIEYWSSDSLSYFYVEGDKNMKEIAESYKSPKLLIYNWRDDVIPTQTKSFNEILKLFNSNKK